LASPRGFDTLLQETVPFSIVVISAPKHHKNSA
jgi:hypothetical protein